MPDPATGHPAQFATTRWSVVIAARDEATSAARDALATLCEAYWYPLYAYVRRRGHDSHDAHDLTQGFFARLLEKDFLADVDPQRGRFRSFLLACLKHFLSNERDRERALKRGGGRRLVPIDVNHAEQRYRHEPIDKHTPERHFEHLWACTVLDQALAQLQKEFERDGKGDLFHALKSHLMGDAGDATYADLAAKFGMTEDAVKAAAHRLRKRYQKAIRQQIAQTVTDEAAVELELQYLFKALSG